MIFKRRKYWHTPPLDIIGGGLPHQAPSITLHARPVAARTVTLNETIKNSAAYVQSWAKKLKTDSRIAVTAAGAAEKAASLILNTVTA